MMTSNIYTKIESALAHLLLGTLLAGVMVITAQTAQAQDRFLLRVGTTLPEVQQTFGSCPALVASLEGGETLQLKNEFLSVEYSFGSKGLERMKLERSYENRKVAKAGLDGYLIYLERINAAIVPIHRSETEYLYYAITDEVHYEIHLQLGRKGSLLTVKTLPPVQNDAPTVQLATTK